MAKLYNLARMTTATTGTGTITLGSAVSGFLTFALAGVANAEVVAYGIRDGANSEVGTGTYTSAGTTLTRTVSKSTNSDTEISLSGTAQVYITATKEDIVNLREVNTISSTQFNFNDTTLNNSDGTATDFWPDGGKINVARTNIRTVQLASYVNDAFGVRMEFAKSRGTTLGSFTAVALDDELMRITAWGANGTGWSRAGYLGFYADGAISGGGAADMPGRCEIALSPDGSATPTALFRLSKEGNLNIGSAAAPTSKLTVQGPIATSIPSFISGSTSTYTMLATDSSFYSASSAACTITLLAASSYPGRWFYVHTEAAVTLTSASSNVKPITGGAAGTAILPATVGAWAVLQSDGTNWITMMKGP